ncbi:WXG100 family type VII secretion target [Streptomyces sp. IBSBF 2435]|uniref:WXG100 family type VII secretion target n=1 Tax=Streptomyces sp. IBSBF 2435 TaxID=2903531 RepID=UPI002FDC0F7E
MANVNLRHEGVSQAVEDMQRVANDMLSAVEDLMNQLQPLASSFSGMAAEVFEEISKNRQQIYHDLTANFSAGSSTLDTMHQSLNDGDRRGASILGG